MRLTFPVFVLMTLCSISDAAPPANFGGTGVNQSTNSGWGGGSSSPKRLGGWGGSGISRPQGSWGGTTVSQPPGGWGGSSASRPQGGWGGSGASATPGGWGVVCYSAVPHPPPTSVTDSITTSTGSTFTTPNTATPTIAHENWGKGSYTVTSVYPTAHTDHLLCPTGYTSYINLPAGTQSGSSYSDPSPTSTSSVVPSPSSDPSPSTPPNPQNLNGNDKPTSAAVSSFKLSLVVTVLGTISAVALVI